jgi:adenylate kinase
MGSVIYLTGAPATGKSTLGRALATEVPGLQLFCYSEHLRDLVNRRAPSSVTESSIREKSAAIVTSDDVKQLDEQLVGWVAAERARNPIVIDSHPVTKENFGFRVTPFSHDRVRELSPDFIVCMYAAPEVIEERIRADPQGRPLPTRYELSLHTQAQINVAVQYGIILGRPCYLVDSSTSQPELVATVRRLTKLT